MKYLTILILSMVSAGSYAEDYFFFELTQNINLDYVPLAGRSDSWEGEYPMSERFGYHEDLGNGLYISSQYEHGSSLFRGKPFNNKKETTFNWVGTTIGWKF